ncbi:hypothetical protein [Dietzia maris]|uniref:hypothetical protein n=1 Tax=Dietzia maris TaxID=37915 RepID=UPI0037C550D7
MMAESAVSLAIADGVGTLTLNRPEDGNAFDAEFTDGLCDAVAELARTSGLRCVLIRAAGPRG